MNEQIADFPNTRLYNNALISHESVSKRVLSDLPTIEASSDEAKDVLDPVVVFFDTAGCEFYERNESDSDTSNALGGKKGLGEGSKSNTNEAEVVVRWAKQLVSERSPHFGYMGIEWIETDVVDREWSAGR